MNCKQFGSAIAVAAMLMLPAPALAQYTNEPLTTHEWVVSGQVGSAFGAAAEDAAPAFGGSLTYLHEGAVGAEVLAGFAPDLDLDMASTDESTVANFMFNGVAALPLGDEGRWQPFVSGGVGAMTISSELEMDGLDDLLDVDDTQLGGNVGFGLMAFGDRWGVRTDVRYFTGFGGDEGTNPADLVDPNDFLSDVDFWRANMGVAYRW